MNISEVTRRNIIDYLLSRGYPFHGRLDLISFLKRIWDLSLMPSTDHRFKTAEGDIWQHMINNNDWDYEYLLYTYLDLLKCDDQIFLTFLETCLHPVVLYDEKYVSETLSEFNKYLAPDGYRLEVASQISVRPIYKSVRSPDRGEYIYEVAFSYASEDREYVEAVAQYLKNNHVKVFYDKYEEVDTWGKDLSEYFHRIYGGSARYCVMFISENYAKKPWTTYERRIAFAKAIENRQDYILPARFDDTKIDGLISTICYLDLSKMTPEQLGENIIRKLGR